MRRLGWIGLLLVLLAAAGTSPAQEFLSRPDIPGYGTPQSQFPAPRAGWLEYLDVAALAVGLLLASFFALKLRWRRGLFLLAIGSLLWFGFWRKGCVCAIGSLQNVTLATADASYVIPLVVVAFFALPILVTLFFGRTFCASVCPLGAVQELTLIHPVRVPDWLEHGLGILPFVYLGVAVAFAASGIFVICEYDPYVGFFRLSGGANMIVFGLALLVVGFFVGRPYCRFLCPLGAVFGLCSRVTRRHVRIPPEECIQCRLCEDACPYGAIREPTVDQSPAERARGRKRLAGLLVLAPVLVGVGAWLGTWLKVPMANMHPDVALAERVLLEETGRVEGTTDASEAFRTSGRKPAELYAEAMALRDRFGVAGAWLGAWVGLVVGVKLIGLSVRRRRTEWQPDPARCVSCGRCFWYCPGEQVRLGLITPEEFESKKAEARSA